MLQKRNTQLFQASKCSIDLHETVARMAVALQLLNTRVEMSFTGSILILILTC